MDSKASCSCMHVVRESDVIHVLEEDLGYTSGSLGTPMSMIRNQI